MALTDKSITEFPNGTLTEGSLFVAADVNAGTGYASTKHSASAMGAGMCGEDFTYAALETGNKSIFKAINELNSIGSYVTLTDTLTAGSTSITFTDNRITADSMIECFTSVMGVNPISESHTDGSITYTFEAQASDLVVGINIMGEHPDSGGGSDVQKAQGTFTSGTTQYEKTEINCGFEPDLVIVNMAFGNGFTSATCVKNGNGLYDSVWNLRPIENATYLITMGSSSGETGITDITSTGFKYRVNGSNTFGKACDYIAYKFGE